MFCPVLSEFDNVIVNTRTVGYNVENGGKGSFFGFYFFFCIVSQHVIQNVENVGAGGGRGDESNG